MMTAKELALGLEVLRIRFDTIDHGLMTVEDYFKGMLLSELSTTFKEHNVIVPGAYRAKFKIKHALLAKGLIKGSLDSSGCVVLQDESEYEKLITCAVNALS